MADPNLIHRLRQKKTDALAAKYLHTSRIVRLHRFIRIADLLALAVPIGYGAIRLLAKDTAWMPPVEFLWELSAAALLIITVAKLVGRWQERAENHTKLMGENIGVASQVDYFSTLFQRGSLNDDAINLFLLPADLDKADAEALSDTKDAEKQDAYRNALKQMGPDAVCRECGASPWQYTPGSCQMCGGTPKQGGKP